ncbi:MAG: nucleotidyltransferase domain-containing protein [Myxococcota bacterium]
MTRPPPETVARAVLAREHPGAVGAFMAGSIVRGEATETSDIDLVVLYASLEHAWRHSLELDGWPVEVFVHDPETLAWFFEEDRKQGIPSMHSMVAEGWILGDHPLLQAARDRARAGLAAGPPPWNPDSARYGLTDLRDDLRSPRNPDERFAIVARLHDPLADFWLRAQGEWSAKGKSVPRRLKAVDPVFAARFGAAFRDALGPDGPKDLLALVDEVLAPHGGPRFAGFRLDAPADWRIPGSEHEEAP